MAFVARVGAPNLLQIQNQLHHLLNNQFCENDVILSLLIDNACTVQDIQTGGMMLLVRTRRITVALANPQQYFECEASPCKPQAIAYLGLQIKNIGIQR